MSRVSRYGLLAVAAIVVAAGCADERPPRSFVQPNIIKKKDLDGTYYYIQTVSDAPPTNGSMFIGQSSSLMKIRFDVQEDYLYARRAFEQVVGSTDGKANADAAGAAYKDMPLAAWRISKQFDVIRDYNSTTGEQTNKIIESEERPWQEREFIRVDWSQNLVTDYVGIGIDIFFSDGSPKVEPVSYWESDPTSPDALHMERQQADDPVDGFKAGDMTYLDITNQLIITPDNLTVTYEEGGVLNAFSVPKCFLAYEQDDCASQKVKIRHAFAKIGPTHDYEPRTWDGNQMQLFGVWDVGLRRMTYNRQYGVTNSGFVRTAARFNIWQKSFQDDGHTPIPYADRKIRQHPYYAEGSQTVVYNGHPIFPDGMVDSIYPPELYPQFTTIIRQWDDAMKDAVADLTGKTIAKGDGTPYLVFVPCHSPVLTKDIPDGKGGTIKADDAVCTQGLAPDLNADGTTRNDKNGNPIYHNRPGDPRHSAVFWVNQQQNAGPLGYGPPLFDPENGETISGQAYIYGAALDTYAARSRDLMLLANGEISASDFTQGVNVQDWVDQHRFGTSQRASRTFDRDQVMAMSRAMDFKWAKAFSPTNGYPALDPSSSQNLLQSMSARQSAIWNGYFNQPSGASDRDARMSKLIGSPIEKMMMTPEMLAIAGVSPAKQWDQLDPGEKLLASPLRAKALADAQEAELHKAEALGVDFASFDDPGIGQHLNLLLAKYGPTLAPMSEQILTELRQQIFLAVTLHEVGHNMGCRHNFRASYDSLNYFPQYWQLRTQAAQMPPDPGMKPGDGKLHPRYVNMPGGAVTQFEQKGAVREYQYSSIMDYGAEFNSDLQGLGLYDKALIKFSYAQFVEVFTDNKSDNDTLKTIGSLHAFQSALGFPSPLASGGGLAAIPYHKYPNLFTSGADGIYKRADVPYSDVSTKSLDMNGNTIVSDSQGRPLVPYYFCSDEFVGNLTCQRFDAGADAYEQASDIISRYQNFYLYNNFKRDRQSFHSSLGYKSRIYGRYFEMLREQLTWYVLLRSDFQSFLSDDANLGFGDPTKVVEQENKFFVDEDGWGNFTVAISLGFDLLGQVLTTPNAGWHMKSVTPTGQTLWKKFRDDTTQISDPRIKTVDLIDGKYVDTTWDFSGCGYYWADECQTRIGYFVDKTVALNVLSESQAYFTGRDTTTDVRQYAIGYIIPFKSQIEEKFGALFSQDLQSLAPYFVHQQGADTPVNPSWVMNDPTIQKNNNLIDPATGFTIALYAGVYGLAAFPSTFDHDFIDTTKVFVVGNGEASTPDATIMDPSVGTSDATQLVSHPGGTKEWFVVKDPTSGKVFAAHATPAASTTVLDTTSSSSAGSQYTTKTVALRNDQGVRMLEQLQQLGQVLGTVNALPDSEPTKATKLANATSELQKFRENIEVMRSLQHAFGYGPFFTDAPFYY